ncbi:MAG: efflux RND transporter periplasmic adaptor subunit [Bacteroidales bacterium]|nr:efflux RND transporter periplasmic adaptor subunit [Bacteroidales bacterium]
MNRKLIIVIAILIIIGGSVLLMMFFEGMKKEVAKSPTKEMILSVKTDIVKYSDIKTSVNATGRLTSQQYVDLSTEVQGKILEGNIPLKKGQTFKKGDLLIRIFNKEAFYNLQARKSRFLNSIANILPDMKIDFPDIYDSWVAYFESITIDKDLDDLPKIQSDKEKIFLAGRSILNEYFTIKSEEIRLKKYSIYAPFSGAYMDVLLEVGSIANPGSRVAKIIRTDKLELEVPIEIDDANWINVNDKADVISKSGQDHWEGFVIRKSPFVDPGTQSINIFISISNSSETTLYKGQYLQAIFPGKTIKNAMEMPRNAVFNSDEVFIVENEKLIKKQIDILKYNEKTLIFSGLLEGAELVVEPLVNAQEHSAVKILN